jgi:multidrug transporter EmrE-like cation transporter
MINSHIKRVDFILIAIFLQSFSFLSIKYASMYESYSFILLGIAFTFIMSRAYIWQIVLKYNELSRVYPFNSLVQVLIFVYAVVLFGENISIWNVIGLSFMIYGVILLDKNK